MTRITRLNLDQVPEISALSAFYFCARARQGVLCKPHEMNVKQTRQGSPYRCQSKAAYLALELLDIVISFLAGSSGISGGRWYLVEACLPYQGKLAFRCKSKLGFRVNESQICNKSPELQKELLHSYMDLRHGPGSELPDLQIEKALLPAVCAIDDSYPEITVTPGQAISIRIRKTTRWEIPESIVDEVYPRLLREAHQLELALAQIESSGALAITGG